jgi:S-adenosylmethionine hydrolase
VHVVVIDPGVGSSRTALAVESEGRFLVGPDNGVLSPALLHAGMRCVSLPVPPGASATFHGRDVFAPAAAGLAQGFALDALGEPFADPVIRRTPEATRRGDGAVAGVVITIDRFGNAVTNLMAWRGGVLLVADRRLPLSRAYADVERGAPMALVGSSGLVEIALREGNAAAKLGLVRGTEVVLLPA